MPSIVERPQGVVEVPGNSPNHRASLKVLSRNIDKVVLGNMLFDTWYYSPYPDSLVPGPVKAAHDGRNGGLVNGTSAAGQVKDSVPCPRLHVCPFCFRYSTKEADYVQHLVCHQEARQNGRQLGPVPESAFKVYEWDGYAVWEIDGEKEKLYCQNLSLFGKLFLEQKSVFFDTGGFKYYVLTHTPTESSPPSRPKARKRSVSVLDESLFQTKVLGFFSKENLSWDSNNLACILIFPPFQHRQLGQLLMAVSYKLSGWEWEGGTIGGPEKPLSAMGRRSYLRFWSERVARFFMSESADADQHKVFETGRKPRSGYAKEEMSIKEVGDRTGMLPEDVIAALNEMGVCEVKTPKRKKRTSNPEPNGTSPPEEEESSPASIVISRSRVLDWAQAHSVDIVSAVKEEGFLGEWAMSEGEGDDVEPGHHHGQGQKG
ncbi:hypothetical protein DV735_g2830, partial [Chaetothyriales sp. CBS 134920]